MAQVNIGRNIKRLRDARGLTQEQIAQALKVSFQAVSKMRRAREKETTPAQDKL